MVSNVPAFSRSANLRSRYFQSVHNKKIREQARVAVDVILCITRDRKPPGMVNITMSSRLPGVRHVSLRQHHFHEQQRPSEVIAFW